MGRRFFDTKIDTIFSWEYDDPQLSGRSPDSNLQDILKIPPKSAAFSVQEAKANEHAMVRSLEDITNRDEAYWVVIRHFLESSKHLLKISADVTNDNNTPESITADDTYFEGNEKLWEQALTKCFGEIQDYRMTANQGKYFKAISGDEALDKDNESPAVKQHRSAHEALNELLKLIEGRKDEIQNVLDSRSDIRPMSKNGETFCKYAKHMCHQAKLMTDQWRESLPELPRERGGGGELPPMG